MSYRPTPPRRGAKGKRKFDEDVVTTQPDKRRATREDDDDFEEGLVETETTKERDESYTPYGGDLTTIGSTIGEGRRLRASQRAKMPALRLSRPFKFMDLPLEIRWIIYKYLLRSTSATHPVELVQRTWFRKGGIRTAILTVSRKVYSEAIEWLYNENLCWTEFGGYYNGIPFRKDAFLAGSRKLRSGEIVDMTKHTGLIYEHMFHQLRNVKLSFVFPSNVGRYYYWDCEVYNAVSTYKKAGEIVDVLDKHQAALTSSGVVPATHKWTIEIVSRHCPAHGGRYSLRSFRCGSFPILNSKIDKMLQQGWLSLHLVGEFPRGWQDVYKKFVGLENFVTDKVTEYVPPERPYDRFHYMMHFQDQNVEWDRAAVDRRF